MGDIKQFYNNTEDSLPHPAVKQFVQMNIKQGNAIDLGCGIGRDTIYLIKNGWNVLAIDKENTEKNIADKLDDKEIKRFSFSMQNFKDIELKQNTLLVANFSIPFCSKRHFKEFWTKINDSILSNRILCWKLFRFK